MSHHWSSNLLLPLIVVNIAPTWVIGGDADAQKLQVGAMYRSELFATQVSTIVTQDGTSWRKLLTIQRVHLDLNSEARSYEYHSMWLRDHLPYRSRIAYDCFWGSGSAVDISTGGQDVFRVPLCELHFADPTNRQGYQEALKRYPGGRSFIPGLKYGWSADLFGEYILSSEQRQKYRLPGKPDEIGPVTDFFYDFIPVASDEVRFFIVSKEGCDVWRGKGTWNRKSEAWNVAWSAKPIESFKVGFLEPFWATGSEKEYQFVTQSGKFIVAAMTEAGSRKTTREWTSGTYPIVSVISDADTGRNFAFTKPWRSQKEDGKPYYFELTKNVQRIAYDREALLKDIKDSPAAMTALARFLVDQKKITLKK